MNNMSILKNWKGLYNTEKNNRKLYEEQYKKIYAENIEYQKLIKKLKYNLTKARIDLEDCKGFLQQEKQVSYALRQERNKLLTKIKKIKEEKTKEELQ